MRFEFATANRIIFGPGAVNEVGALAAAMGKHGLVVIGSSQERAAPLLAQLQAQALESTLFSVTGEPTTAVVHDGVRQARAAGCDMVIGMGGGSVIDAGKAIAALLTNGGEPLDYLEVIGRGQPLTRPAAPYIAIPTTAGTGAEVTRNAVLASPEHLVKVSLRSPLMLPALAVVDPELTYSIRWCCGRPFKTNSALQEDIIDNLALRTYISPFVSNCISLPMAIIEALRYTKIASKKLGLS